MHHKVSLVEHLILASLFILMIIILQSGLMLTTRQHGLQVTEHFIKLEINIKKAMHQMGKGNVAKESKSHFQETTVDRTGWLARLATI